MCTILQEPWNKSSLSSYPSPPGSVMDIPPGLFCYGGASPALQLLQAPWFPPATCISVTSPASVHPTWATPLSAPSVAPAGTPNLLSWGAAAHTSLPAAPSTPGKRHSSPSCLCLVSFYYSSTKQDWSGLWNSQAHTAHNWAPANRWDVRGELSRELPARNKHVKICLLVPRDALRNDKQMGNS